VNFNRYVATEVEGIGSYQSIAGVLIQDYAVVAGPRLNYRGLFVHGLFGFDHLRGSYNGVSEGQNAFAMALGGGTVVRLTEHVGVRTSLDYVLTRHNVLGGARVNQNNVRAGAGLVWYFGGHGVGKSKARTSSAPTPVIADSSLSIIPALGLRGRADERGFYITSLEPNSPLQNQGVTSNDILYSINGTRIHSAIEAQAALPNSGAVKVVVLVSRGAPIERTVEIK
jgi:hypothetical protein